MFTSWYILKAPVEEENGEKMELYTLDTWYQLGKTNISVSFMGISENSTFYQDLELPENEDEIIVTKPLAQKLNLKLGDLLEVSFFTFHSFKHAFHLQ